MCFLLCPLGYLVTLAEPAGRGVKGHARCWAVEGGWRGGAGGGPLLFSLTHSLGLPLSSLCGSGDRDDP